MENLKVVVAGHLDHGKSTLIGRLLYKTGSLPASLLDNARKANVPGGSDEFAFVTDQLAEEQAEGITIDTVPIELKTAQRNYTLIDTPGHKEFLKNMLTGATNADAAIILIDAAEGLLEQTYLHTFLIAMLGIRNIIVIINIHC